MVMLQRMQVLMQVLMELLMQLLFLHAYLHYTQTIYLNLPIT